MRKLPLSVTISAAIHIAAVAYVAAREAGREDSRPEHVTTTQIEVIPRSPPPPPPPGIDVQFLDEATTRMLESSQPAPATTPRRKRATAAATAPATGSISTGTTGTTETAPGGTTGGEPTGPRSTYFDMRRGSRPDLTLPGTSFRDALDNPPAGTGPAAKVPATGQLEHAAGGRRKSHQDVFVARVERDGTVKLRDTRNLQAELSWNPAKLLSGRFDVNDYLMRSSGNDPYASRKLKFLDETRDERVEIGKQWRREQLQQTAIIMRKNLARAWSSSPDIAAKKRALFELWDEIVEPDGRDEILAEASRAARKAVIGFIRARLPHGSAHAFTDAELVAMNRSKQSAARFAPYD